MTDQEPVVKLTFDDRENAGRIACVTFNNPEQGDALGRMGKDLLAEILTDLKHEEGLRAVRAQKRMMTAFMNRKGN